MTSEPQLKHSSQHQNLSNLQATPTQKPFTPKIPTNFSLGFIKICGPQLIDEERKLRLLKRMLYRFCRRAPFITMMNVMFQDVSKILSLYATKMK
jgi:hypothetical protein